MASVAGRGAQVRLDGDDQAAARGALAPTLDGNVEAKRVLEFSGLAADGSTPDGSTITGLAAEDEILAAAGSSSPIIILERVMAETITATTLVAGAAAVPIKTANLFRKTLHVMVTGAGDVAFGWTSGVTASTGWLLTGVANGKQGADYPWGLGAAPPGTLYAYSAAGSTVLVKEGT